MNTIENCLIKIQNISGEILPLSMQWKFGKIVALKRNNKETKNK